MGLIHLDEPYSLSTWYECTGAYDLHVGTDLMLDLAREIIDSDAYIYQGVVFPKLTDLHTDNADAIINAGVTFSGTITLAAFSYLISISGYAGNYDQFTVRIYDKGAQTDLYFRQFGWFPTIVGNMQDQPNLGSQILQQDQNKPISPYMFRSPLIILPPGQLQIQVTNVSLQDATPMQLLLGLAVPRNTVTMLNRKVVTSQDQTGVESLQAIGNLISS